MLTKQPLNTRDREGLIFMMIAKMFYALGPSAVTTVLQGFPGVRVDDGLVRIVRHSSHPRSSSTAGLRIESGSHHNHELF
jgi:hypothetical protein